MRQHARAGQPRWREPAWGSLLQGHLAAEPETVVSTRSCSLPPGLELTNRFKSPRVIGLSTKTAWYATAVLIFLPAYHGEHRRPDQRTAIQIGFGDAAHILDCVPFGTIQRDQCHEIAWRIFVAGTFFDLGDRRIVEMAGAGQRRGPHQEFAAQGGYFVDEHSRFAWLRRWEIRHVDEPSRLGVIDRLQSAGLAATMATMEVEVLAFEGCPNMDTAMQRARAAVESTRVPAAVRLVRVESNQDAKRLRFLGSPTVRVEGVDVDESAQERDDFGLQCRVYSVAGKFEGAPPVEWISAALLRESLNGGASSPSHARHASRGVAIAAELAATMTSMDGAQTLFLAAVRLLAFGEPVPIERLARAVGTSEAQVIALLECFPNIERDSAGAIVGCALTLRPTPHRVEIEGRQLYAWCALDTLFLPVVLQQTVRVESSCAASAAPIELRVGAEGVVEFEPAEAVVSLLSPSGIRDLRGSFCNNVHFFSCPDAARDWLVAHPLATVVPVAEAFAIAHDFIVSADPHPVGGAPCCSADNS